MSHSNVHDPVLDIENQHHHGHTHHSQSALPATEGEPVYASGTSFDRSMPIQDHVHDNVIDHFTEKHINKGLDRDEKNAAIRTNSAESGSMSEKVVGRFSSFYRRFKFVFHILIWMLFTGWFIAGVVLHRKDKGWLIPFLVYLCITLRILFWYVPISIVTKPMHFMWNNTAVKLVNLIPEKFRLWAGAALTFVIIVIGSFASAEAGSNTRANRAVSLFGLILLIAGLWATSANRKAIQWHTVIVGMLLQFLIALFVLRTKAGYDIFSFVSGLAGSLLGFAAAGVAFLTTPDIAANDHFFFFSVLPAIVFFISLTSLLFYCGALQWLIGKCAVFFFWSMRVSGAEAVVASASPFIGQGESAMLIKPFIPHLTKAELHQIMASGFATIAGSVLVAYISMGIPGHALISSCVMSIPASLATSKLRYPETEESLTRGRVVVPEDDAEKPKNALQAFANGAWLGLKIAGMIMATLLCIIAFLALCNGLLGWWGRYLNIPELTIQQIVGYLCYPIAFLLGVPRGPDLYKVATLIGTKLIANEFVAFGYLSGTDPSVNGIYLTMDNRSKLIATFALCSFANIGSLGTQIGVLSQIAPGRGGDVAQLAVSALITGALSTFSSASIAGMIITNENGFIIKT